VPSSLIKISTPIEIVWVHLHIGNGDSIVIGSFYGPPQSADVLLDDLQSSIADVKQKFPHSQIILGGDFNCPGINWQNGTLLNLYVSCHFQEKLIPLSQNNCYFQVVTFPTREQDLCFTIHPDSVLKCKPAPGFSDHNTVIIKFQAYALFKKQIPRKIYLYNCADWDAIKERLSTLTDEYFNLNSGSPQDVDENWNFFPPKFPANT